MPKQTKTTKVKGWIGDISWLPQPCNTFDNFSGQQYGVLFQTRKDALQAGWNKPRRVEVIVRAI